MCVWKITHFYILAIQGIQVFYTIYFKISSNPGQELKCFFFSFGNILSTKIFNMHDLFSINLSFKVFVAITRENNKLLLSSLKLKDFF